MEVRIISRTNPNQEAGITKQQISDFLCKFKTLYKEDELNTMQTYCEKMWDHEEGQGNLTAFRPKLQSLLEDMKKHTDLRVACFDLITQGASDYLAVFSGFFQLQALVLKNNESCHQSESVQDPFSGDPDYELLRGSPEHGVVVLYPQLHQVEDDLQNLFWEDLILASQLSIYRDFLIKKAEHLYIEGTTPSDVQVWNDYDFAVNPMMSSIYHSIAQAIANNQPLSDRQKYIFMKAGGAGFYANMCKLNNTPVTKYPIEKEGEYAKLVSMTKGKFDVRQLTENGRYVVYDSREERVETVVAKTATSRQGKPAYVVMGYVHTFDKVFQLENSPAVYRKKFDPPLKH